MQVIKIFKDGTIIEQGRGKFDDYCVFLTKKGMDTYAPTDVDYFTFFIDRAKIYGSNRIYGEFVEIYEKTNDKVENVVLDYIEQICARYDNEQDALMFSIWYTVIYLGMVAEEKKKYAVLKKRIKRLGMHQILNENFTARAAAYFSRGKKVAELDPMCKERGF